MFHKKYETSDMISKISGSVIANILMVIVLNITLGIIKSRSNSKYA